MLQMDAVALLARGAARLLGCFDVVPEPRRPGVPPLGPRSPPGLRRVVVGGRVGAGAAGWRVAGPHTPGLARCRSSAPPRGLLW